MALDSTITKTAITNFVNGIGTAGNKLDVENLVFNRSVSKKFVKMLGKVKSTTATVGANTYTLTAPGAVSMFELFDEGESLAPSYNENGTLDINSDVNLPTVVLGGTFVSKATNIVDGQEFPVAFTQEVSGKTVSIYDATFADHIYVVAKSNEQVNLEGCIIDNRNGGISTGKSSQNNGNKAGNNANCAVNVAGCNPKSVAMKDMVYYCSDNQGNQKMYNLIEITGGSATKKIDIEGCQFLGKATNNGVSIYDCADGAVINVKDCWFEDVSNVLRVSNQANKTNVTINFENCVIESWEHRSGAYLDYAGFCICQDYTSPAANAAANNLYGKDANGNPKITINIKNCTGPNGPIQIASGKTYADYCMNSQPDQLCYVYRDKAGGLVPFDADVYPVINVSYHY